MDITVHHEQLVYPAATNLFFLLFLSNTIFKINSFFRFTNKGKKNEGKKYIKTNLAV